MSEPEGSSESRPASPVSRLYTMSADTIAKFHTDNLKYTIPFVLYGIFRYLYLIHQKSEGGSPERILFDDKPLLINIVLYLATVWFFTYS